MFLAQTEGVIDWFGLVLWCLTPLSTIFQQTVLLVEETGGPRENHQSTLTNFIK
jgi:hypothetical protein